MLAGILGKPNVGKSTFFNAATMLNVPVANYPFTTIKPNFGTAYIRIKCVHEEFGVKDNPVNSACVDGTRLIPVRLVDVAGLVPGASKGRGLGNKFLDDVRQADAIIHVVDASGSTDEEGRAVPPGSHDPSADVEFVGKEVLLWVRSIIEKDWSRISRTAESGGKSGGSLEEMLLTKLSGLSINEAAIEEAIRDSGLKPEKPTTWSDEDLTLFARTLLRVSKPFLIVANKCDQLVAREIIERLVKKIGGDSFVVPCAAEAELVLRRASEKHLIEYVPGDGDFKICKDSSLNDAQSRALELIRKQVFDVWHGTGVQKAINEAYLKLLRGIVVYPVEDESKLTDKKGNVLPDARIMRDGQTAQDLAFAIHTDLGNSFLYAVDARTGMRLGADYRLKNNDVLKIVAAARKS
jgi:ribosome-binding ATPase YchF (GTP1/OBG family)